MRPLVTVIVPIYNTAEYLPRCIESIQNQTYINIEILLLDDGSTDHSGSICETYAKEDSRIGVIRQTNQGIIAAKKTALRYSHGDYVMFVDSDDWIENLQLESMVERMLADSCSLVCANVFVDRKGSTIIKRNGIPAGTYDTGKISRDLFYYKDSGEYGVLPYSVAKLYPRKMLSEVLEKIDSQIRYAEDKAIVFGFVFQNIRVCFMEESYYHYCVRETSICQSGNSDYLIELTCFYKYAKKLFEIHAERQHLLRQLGCYLMTETRNAIDRKLGLAGLEDPISRRSYELDPSVFCEQTIEVVLYGAGKVGEDYQKKLKESEKIHLCGWVDKNFAVCQEKGLDVQPVESIRGSDYDYILIAVKNELVFYEIKAELMQMGIREEKIIWGKPLRVSYI